MATTSSRRRSGSTSRRPGERAARSRARANGRPTDAAPGAHARANGAADGATGTLTQVVKKVKRPALAGGAALVAVAGGVALAARNGGKKKGVSLPSIGRRRRGIRMSHVQMPHVQMPHVSVPHLPHRSDGETTDALRATAKALGAAAVEVGKVGYRAGELASEVRRLREQAGRTSV